MITTKAFKKQMNFKINRYFKYTHTKGNKKALESISMLRGYF